MESICDAPALVLTRQYPTPAMAMVTNTTATATNQYLRAEVPGVATGRAAADFPDSLSRFSRCKSVRMSAAIQPDVRMLKARDDVGRAISREEEGALLKACQDSRSRPLYPAVVLALNTCMRYSELRLLQWKQVDLAGRTLTVGQSKTESGTGRMLPLNERASAILTFWASLFPGREQEHYVFPAERYGAACGTLKPITYGTDPSKPIGRWKEAWESAKIRAGVRCRFHDLRHTGCSRMLEAGVPLSVVATVMGWSASTTVRMAKRYGHIGQAAQRQAVQALSGADFEGDGAQNWAQSQTAAMTQRAN